jgi:2-aminobenzoate-CoA ligase
VLNSTHNDVVVGSPPLAFTFGLGGLLLFPMTVGASVYFAQGPLNPETMVKAMQDAACTICYTAPTFYRQMAAVISSHPVPSLRISVSAGEALPDATRQLWKSATGLEMVDGIGATELFHIFISSAAENVRAGTIGQVVPGYLACVMSETGEELPSGQIGILAVRGPTGCKYLSDQRQKSYVHNGWNITGDMVMQDIDGYIHYQSRSDDMIISAGYNIGGPEVEDALLSHPAVAECGVVGKPDAERGMVVQAFCVLSKGYEPGPELIKLLQDHVKSTLAPYKYPRDMVFLNQLPRTPTGKLQRFKLRDLNPT